METEKITESSLDGIKLRKFSQNTIGNRLIKLKIIQISSIICKKNSIHYKYNGLHPFANKSHRKTAIIFIIPFNQRR